MTNPEAEKHKAIGNTHLQSNNLTAAIESYTAAINIDGTNHLYYSNRSAAYLKKGDAQSALEDAKSTIALDPNFSKGYSRKGAALHALKRYNDAIAAFEEGLKKFPGDKALEKGLEDVKREKEGPARGAAAGGGFGGMFGQHLLQRIALDPKTRHYLNDKEFMAKIQMLQRDPSSLSAMLSDPRIMEVLGVALGGAGAGMDDVEDGDGRSSPSKNAKPQSMDVDEQQQQQQKQQSSSTTQKEQAAAEEEEDEDLSQLSPAEQKKKQDQKLAVQAKLRGNDLYKSKQFDEALAAYDEAIALDPTNMTFHSNKAAVYFTSKQYDECIAACREAVEVGKANRAPFEERAKALTRCAKAYQKKGDLEKAIECCREAQLESFDKATERMMKNMELEKKKMDAAAYQDEGLAEEAKQRGNEHFRNKEW